MHLQFHTAAAICNALLFWSSNRKASS